MKLLIIDPNVTMQSPSMKGVVRSLPRMKELGIEVEIWCWYCEDGVPATVRKLPRLGDWHTVGSYFFSWIVFWRAWWLYTVLRVPRPDVIYSVAWYYTGCDICHVHFSQFDWLRCQRRLGVHSLRDLVERVISVISLLQARWFLWRTRAQKLLCVSKSVAADMREASPSISCEVLPNSYDPTVFHYGVRERKRDVMRQKLGYGAEDKVFIFVSAGHYRRKGFFLALEALKRLQKRFPKVRFLVVGGRPERLALLQDEMGEKHDWVTFTGMVPDVQNYMAAADAFLFPSYSEAFALVEVEAAACGLPLFLTPHHGSEMIMEEGVNGRFIEFDPQSIAEVLGSFLDGCWQPKGVELKHAIDSLTYADLLAQHILSACRAS